MLPKASFPKVVSVLHVKVSSSELHEAVLPQSCPFPVDGMRSDLLIAVRPFRQPQSALYYYPTQSFV